MLKVISLIAYSFVRSGDGDPLLVPVLGTFLFSREAALLFTQLLERLLEISRVLELDAIAVDGVVLEANVDTYGFFDDYRLSRTSIIIDQQIGEPFARGHVLDDNALDVAFDRTVSSNRDVGYLAQVQ